MNIRAVTFVLATLAATALPALAVDAPSAGNSQGRTSARADLSALCDSCAVVDSVKAVTRKGKAGPVGVVGGAVVGGLLGNQIGRGSGKTLATAGGAVAGGLAGGEVERRVKKYTVWVTQVTLKNGTKRTFEQRSAPPFKAGDVVHVEGNRLVRK